MHFIGNWMQLFRMYIVCSMIRAVSALSEVRSFTWLGISKRNLTRWRLSLLSISSRVSLAGSSQQWRIANRISDTCFL